MPASTIGWSSAISTRRECAIIGSAIGSKATGGMATGSKSTGRMATGGKARVVDASCADFAPLYPLAKASTLPDPVAGDARQ